MRVWAVEWVTLSKPLVCVLFLLHKWFPVGKLEIWLGWTGHFQFILFLDSWPYVDQFYLPVLSEHNVSDRELHSENMQTLGSGCIRKSCCRPPLPYLQPLARLERGSLLPTWITSLSPSKVTLSLLCSSTAASPATLHPPRKGGKWKGGQGELGGVVNHSHAWSLRPWQFT